MMGKKIWILSLFLAGLLISLPAESIRGFLSGTVDLSHPKISDQTLTLGLEEIVALVPGDKSRFLQGAELTLQIPAPLRRQAEGFILLIYKRVSPAPSGEIRHYQGVEAAHFVLPNRPRFYVNFNVGSQVGTMGPSGPDTLNIAEAIQPDEFPLLMTLISLSKGIPRDIEGNPLTIKAVPEWNNLGALTLNVANPELSPEDLILKIDGKVRPWSREILLPEGMHLVSLGAPGYGEESVNIAIQKAQFASLEMTLRRQSAALVFEAPKDAVVFLNGEQVILGPGKSVSVEPGTHTVTMLLNDYRISKQFQLNSGQTLKLSLFLDILIQDN